MRHAEARRENRNLTDFERPLNDPGREAARFIGETIQKNRFKIDLILSSPAKRAKQTAELFKETARLKTEIQYNEKIYEANLRRLLEIVLELDNRYNSVLIVGHNPGFENLVQVLTGENVQMATAAFAAIDLEIENWSNIKTACGNLRVLLRSKDVN